jgi:hypothetical protein
MNREDIFGYHPEYLGDGVYASFDDAFQIWLHTEREEGKVERIALDSEVFSALVRYRNKMDEAATLSQP